MGSRSVFAVAINFGMTYSAYRFSLDSGTDQTHQVCWGTEHGLKTPKTPTCILFSQKQEFTEFGYDAGRKCKSLPSSKADTWYFFQNFEMKLYNTEEVSNCPVLLTAGSATDKIVPKTVGRVVAPQNWTSQMSLWCLCGNTFKKGQRVLKKESQGQGNYGTQEDYDQ